MDFNTRMAIEADERTREFVAAWLAHGRNVTTAARALGYSRQWIHHQLARARTRGLLDSGTVEDSPLT